MYYITSKKHLAHSSGSNSRYKGGFTKDGKNTSAYNHDYYIHNKDKWQDNVPTRDPYNPYNPSGFGNTTTNTGYGGSGYQYSGEPINIKSPAEYIRDFLHKHACAWKRITVPVKDDTLHHPCLRNTDKGGQKCNNGQYY